MNKNNRKKLLSACLSTALLWSANANAAEGFVVKDIQVRGLQRVKAGTVLNYLPVQVGESISSASTSEIIKALYDTGFFQSVSLEKQGNTLIVNVVERGTIGDIHVIGNEEIPSDKMKEILKQMGLVKGQVFQRSSLERLEKEFKQVYNARGKYNARVESTVTPLTENRVAVTITISEGRVSRIKQIKFSGNKDFSDRELQQQMSLQSSGFFTYFTKTDQYSKSSMDSSLEAIRSYYLDRGYIKFNIVSSQVMLSPDKKDVYINLQIDEGPQFHFSGFNVVGNTVLPREKIDRLIQVHPGAIFSRKKITESIAAIGLALGDVGYGFPIINAEPKIDEKNKTVYITFVIEPGRHVYVRQINFRGNTKTADYVLRNVIRQDEGSLLSLHNIKESERQLRVLGYLKDINIKTVPVPGTNNQVDLEVEVHEAASAEASASVGWGSNGPQLNASANQRNFMGTGRSVGVNFNGSYWGQDYAFNYYNPFYQPGIGRGFNFYYRSYDPKHLDVIAYSSDQFGFDASYNLLLSENSSFQFGYGFQNLFIRSVGQVQQVQNFVTEYGRTFNEFRLNMSWSRNTYDQMPFPMRGTNMQTAALVALPASSRGLSYYKGTASAKGYQPLPLGFVFSLTGTVGYGNMFNGRGLPFFENYFAGGIAQPGQVRGYEDFSLGPVDSVGHAMGANLLTAAGGSLILPYPFSQDTFRTSVFLDAGNVYACGTPLLLRGFGGGSLRYSAGVAVDWRSPFGPIAVSAGKALNLQPGDQQNIFQLTVSSAL